MRRIGLLDDRCHSGSTAALGSACQVYRELLREHSDLSADRLDTLFLGAAMMAGREFIPVSMDMIRDSHHARVTRAIRTVRSQQPLRSRLTVEGKRLAGLREKILDGFTIEYAASVECLYAEAKKNHALPEDFATAAALIGFDSATLVLHLANPYIFPATDPLLRQAATVFDDAFCNGLPPLEQYHILMSQLRHLREVYRVHPFEFADVIRECAADPETERPDTTFNGFCTDSFHFLADLAANNTRSWMEAARVRYQFAVREPLVELCQALAARYVIPVLTGEYGWDMETGRRPGQALTSICKNDYGRSVPYQQTLWLTFHNRDAGSRQQSAQFFVRIDADGLRYGFLLGPAARAAGRRFRQCVQLHSHRLCRALAATDANESAVFANDDMLTNPVPLRSPEDLRSWASGKTLSAGRFRPVTDPLLRSEELVGEILLTFDRLVPLFAAAVEDDPIPVLSRRAGEPGSAKAYDSSAFKRDTHLSAPWLERTLGLLKLKKQLVLQGLPGTGKTFVARCLARFLAQDREDGIELVQFHPGYGYADFVERPGSDDGQDGVLLRLAARAAVRPAEPFVLVIDELTRGHVASVFGELFYSLEYRGQSVTLPYSRRPFILPENLLLIATVSSGVRDGTAIDPALRRRFAFVEMSPDPAILAHWLDSNPPDDPDPTFGPRVVRLFEQLNSRMARDFGPNSRFGHSLFMLPCLNAERLRAVWEHHVLPQIAETLGRPLPLVGYDLDRFMAEDRDPIRPAPAVNIT